VLFVHSRHLLFELQESLESSQLAVASGILIIILLALQFYSGCCAVGALLSHVAHSKANVKLH